MEVNHACGTACRRLIRVWVIALLVAGLGGCATTPAPVEQIKYFTQAFAAVNTVGQPLLDELALAERAQGKRVAESRAKMVAKDSKAGRGCLNHDAVWAESATAGVGYINGYCPEDAGYFSTLGDPPATAQLRRGLRIIERYSEVLTTLAEGRNIDQAIGEVESLGQEVDGLLAIGGLNVGVTAAVGALKPVLEGVARNANAQETRRLIIDGAPKVTTLIAALRDAAPATFNTLISELRRAANDPAASAVSVKEIEARRVMVSQYVVLLGGLQDAWDATISATRNPDGSRLTDLVARTAQVQAQTEAVRRSLAVLRSASTR